MSTVLNDPLLNPQAQQPDKLSPQITAQFEQELASLSAALEQKLPGFKEYLIKIDRILKSYPEITYLLKEEQIGIIVSGLKQEADIQFFTKEQKATKSKAGKFEVTGGGDDF